MVTRHSILGDTLPIPKAKGMSMRNWMACFLLMTRKVKIKVQKNFSEDKDDIVDKILEETGAEFIMSLGNVFGIYRKNPEKDKK